jgi:hypothetical protein
MNKVQDDILSCTLCNDLVTSYQFRLHEFLQIWDAQSSVPVISDVATIHNFAKQISQVFPWNLGVGLQIVVQNTDTNVQITCSMYKGWQILMSFVTLFFPQLCALNLYKNDIHCKFCSPHILITTVNQTMMKVDTYGCTFTKLHELHICWVSFYTQLVIHKMQIGKQVTLTTPKAQHTDYNNKRSLIHTVSIHFYWESLQCEQNSCCCFVSHDNMEIIKICRSWQPSFHLLIKLYCLSI